VPFVNQALGRLRMFLLVLCWYDVVQALAACICHRLAEINSENLLILLAPLVFIYGAGMYSLLSDQLNLPFPQLRHLVTGIFVLVSARDDLHHCAAAEVSIGLSSVFSPWFSNSGAGWTNGN